MFLLAKLHPHYIINFQNSHLALSQPDHKKVKVWHRSVQNVHIWEQSQQARYAQQMSITKKRGGDNVKKLWRDWQVHTTETGNSIERGWTSTWYKMPLQVYTGLLCHASWEREPALYQWTPFPHWQLFPRRESESDSMMYDTQDIFLNQRYCSITQLHHWFRMASSY